MYLNIGSSNEPPKLSTQTQASQMQQMQSAAVQLLAQGALSRHTALRSQPTVQPTWSNPSLKQHPGFYFFISSIKFRRTFSIIINNKINLINFYEIRFERFILKLAI